MKFLAVQFKALIKVGMSKILCFKSMLVIRLNYIILVATC